MIRLGDKVRFVNENLEGIVTSVKGNKQIGVTIDGDFEIPVLESEVIKIQFQEKQTGNSKQALIPDIKPVSGNPVGVFLSFERIDDDMLKTHIHNNISDKLFVLIYENHEGAWHLIKEHTLPRNETVDFEKRKLSEFNNWKPLMFIMQPMFSVSVNPSTGIKKEMVFSPKTFHQHWKHCFFLNKQAYEFRLDETNKGQVDLEKLKKKDFNEPVRTEKRDLKACPPGIIDLHASALDRDGFGTSSDISSYQMEIFVATLESAFVHHLPEIVYIHGVGNAWLKNKIRTYISKHKDLMATYEDADILKYGGGATRVVFGFN